MTARFNTHCDLHLGFWLQVIDDARNSGVTSIDELDGQTRLEVVTRRVVGGTQLLQESPECQRSTIGILAGCSPQLLYLTAEFGVPILGRLFAPAITPEKLTREFLESMPNPLPRWVGMWEFLS